MSRDEALALLREHKPVLERRFGIVDLALFGSFARDRATAGRDIDILVRFDGPADWRRYFGAQFYIEDLFGRSVDLVTDKALRPELRPRVEREAGAPLDRPGHALAAPPRGAGGLACLSRTTPRGKGSFTSRT